MMSMFHNVPYISKKNVVFFLWSKLIPDTWRYLLAFAFETLQLPFVRRCVAAMPLQTKKCHYCRNANRCKRLSNSDLETTPSRVSTSPSRTGPEHFRPILSVLPLATAPKAPACPNGAICALQATSLTTFDSEKKHLKQEQPPSQNSCNILQQNRHSNQFPPGWQWSIYCPLDGCANPHQFSESWGQDVRWKIASLEKAQLKPIIPEVRYF